MFLFFSVSSITTEKNIKIKKGQKTRVCNWYRKVHGVQNPEVTEGLRKHVFKELTGRSSSSVGLWKMDIFLNWHFYMKYFFSFEGVNNIWRY